MPRYASRMTVHVDAARLSKLITDDPREEHEIAKALAQKLGQPGRATDQLSAIYGWTRDDMPGSPTELEVAGLASVLSIDVTAFATIER